MHMKVAVIVKDATTAQEARAKAEEALEPFDMETEEHFERVDEADVEEVLESAREEGQDVPLIDTTDNQERDQIAKLVGDYFAGDEDCGAWDDESYGYVSTENPYGGTYDWYQIGGRWRGSFKVKAEACDYLVGEAGVSDKGVPGADRADVVRIRDIDFEGMRAEAEEQANADFDRLGPEVDVAREAYVDASVKDAASVYAIVQDDQWTDWDQTHHIPSEEPQEHPTVEELCAELDPASWVVLVDCHC